MLIIGILFLIVMFINENRKTYKLIFDNRNIVFEARIDGEVIRVDSLFDEESGDYYLLLPSFARDQKALVECDDSVRFDSKDCSIGEGLLLDNEQCYSISDDEGEYCLVIKTADNIPSLFIDTESNSLDYVHEIKGNKEKGFAKVINDSGYIEYSNGFRYICGRGSTSWAPEKKSYKIELFDEESLCGMSPQKDWNLISLFYDQDKIHSKLFLDIGREFGCDNTPECEWIDLYCNGQYRGLYLLTQTICLSDDDEWIVQKTIDGKNGDKRDENLSESGYLFSVEEARSEGERAYDSIMLQLNNVDAALCQKNGYSDIIDYRSFAVQYLIDRISMEIDAMICSTYYTMRKGDSKLYAGPLWDYDRTMGGKQIAYYDSTIDNILENPMSEWYLTLYADEDFKKELAEVYKEMLPEFQSLLNTGLDEYKNRLQNSWEMDYLIVKNDSIRETFSYECLDSQVKWFKFFLANRLNYIGKELEVFEEDYFILPASADTMHTVLFKTIDDDIVQSKDVKDGDTIEVPYANAGDDYWHFENSARRFFNQIPIYEDVTIVYGQK